MVPNASTPVGGTTVHSNCLTVCVFATSYPTCSGTIPHVQAKALEFPVRVLANGLPIKEVEEGEERGNVHELIKHQLIHIYNPIIHTSSIELTFHYTLSSSDRLELSLRRFTGCSSNWKSLSPMLLASSCMEWCLAASYCNASRCSLSDFFVLPLFPLLFRFSFSTYSFMSFSFFIYCANHFLLRFIYVFFVFFFFSLSFS